jgi:hypothetical protein
VAEEIAFATMHSMMTMLTDARPGLVNALDRSRRLPQAGPSIMPCHLFFVRHVISRHLNQETNTRHALAGVAGNMCWSLAHFILNPMVDSGSFEVSLKLG